MSLPRLHPEDLQALIDGVSKNVVVKLEEILSRKKHVSEMQTFSVKEVAKILNVDKTTIIRYINHPSNLLKATKIGKNWIITHKSLTNYIDGTVKK